MTILIRTTTFYDLPRDLEIPLVSSNKIVEVKQYKCTNIWSYLLRDNVNFRLKIGQCTERSHYV